MSTDFNTLDLFCKHLRVYHTSEYTVATMHFHALDGEDSLTPSVSQLLALAGWEDPRRGTYGLILRAAV